MWYVLWDATYTISNQNSLRHTLPDIAAHLKIVQNHSVDTHHAERSTNFVEINILLLTTYFYVRDLVKAGNWESNFDGGSISFQ
jgi:hypothetical protein